MHNDTFLPLCGNGKIDGKADYEVWYAMHSEKWFDWKGVAEAKILVDEVCDDGNRLDGDGCSADCLDFDIYTEPCILMMHGLQEGEFMEGFFYAATRAISEHRRCICIYQ